MVYPGRKIHVTLPEFVGTNTIKQTPAQRSRLLAFVSEQYAPTAGVVNAASDVLMVASSDGYKMNLYYTDGNTNALVAWEFDCIDK